MRAHALALTSFIVLLSPTVHAQISLFAYTGTETPVLSVYGFGQVAQGDTKDVIFRARNTGASAVTITKLAMSGTGFSIVNTASIPFTVAPGSSFDFTMRFSGGELKSYSANLQVNTITVLLLATVVAAPTVAVDLPCTGPDSQGLISFGRISQGGQVVCTITLQNSNTQALTVSPITVTGAAFSTTQSPAATIPAGQSISFPIQFTAAGANTFTGSLSAGVRTYALSGTGFAAPIPAPLLTFDSASLASGEQRSLTAKLPAPSPVNASGTLTLTFTPDSTTITDDSAVQFVSIGKRIISFAIAQGSTDLLFNGQKSVTFATGTTAGKLTFTVDVPAYGITGSAATSVKIAQAPVTVTAASATRRANDLDIVISAFDNTYTAGRMSFSFFDANGGLIGPAIAADFSSYFANFFKSQTLGSAFLMRVTFPVTGDATLIRSAEVTLMNTAGSVKTQRLNFP
jgi:hypothetical protein